MENELSNDKDILMPEQSRDAGIPARDREGAVSEQTTDQTSDSNGAVTEQFQNQTREADEATQEAELTRKAALKAAVEAIIYVADDPVTLDQIAAALGASGGDSIVTAKQDVIEALTLLQAECGKSDRGLEIREIAGGYKMFTKPEHHETIRRFVKNLTPPLKLSMAALETLAAIAYKQPITLPEIQQIRGVNAGGTLKTLLDRKLIATAGRKDVIGRPILYKTTKEFLVKFGLSSLSELPTLEEFGELARAALGEPAPASESEFTTEITENTEEQ